MIPVIRIYLQKLTLRDVKTYLAIKMSQNYALAWEIIEVSNSAKRHLDYSRIMQTNDLDLICCSFLTWFGHNFSAGQFLSFCSLLIARMTCSSGFFLLSFNTRFARDIQFVTFIRDNLQYFGYEVHLRSSPSAFVYDQSNNLLRH